MSHDEDDTMKILVADLKPNPFRQLDAYPMQPEKIAALKDSIKSTEFWDNLVVRRAPDGNGFQLAYGHHRLRALKELRIEEIDVPVRKLDDATMLKMMAHENRAEWGASAVVEQETIRAVVNAYATGAIELTKPDKKTPTKSIRVAPRFATADVSSLDPSEHPYTAETIQDFLGFKGDTGLARIKDTLNALALVESGILRPQDIGDLTVYKVKLVQQVAKEYEHSPEVQKKVARGVAKKLRDKDITGFDGERTTRARLEASSIAHAHNVQSKSEMRAAGRGEKKHDQDDEAIKLATAIDTFANYNQTLRRVDVLAEFAQHCGPKPKAALRSSLKKLRDHIDAMILKLSE